MHDEFKNNISHDDSNKQKILFSFYERPLHLKGHSMKVSQSCKMTLSNTLGLNTITPIRYHSWEMQKTEDQEGDEAIPVVDPLQQDKLVHEKRHMVLQSKQKKS